MEIGEKSGELSTKLGKIGIHKVSIDTVSASLSR